MLSSLLSFALYLCSGMYSSNQFLVKEKATITGKLLDLASPGNDAVA
jgi:hypothetical protein